MLTCQKHAFQLPEDVSYLNCAFMSPLMKGVEAAGVQGLLQKRRPFTIEPGDFFRLTDQLRREFARLIKLDVPERVCTIPSVSYGMGVVARNIPLSRGEEILLIEEQFPSNYYAWERLAAERGGVIKVVEAPRGTTERARTWNQRLLEAISPRTRLVALPHVQWADGTRFDLPAIRARSRDVGALLVIDGTQSVGALPFELPHIQPDALVCGGYKWLLGPYSLGLAYLGPAFDGGRPLEESWMNRKGSDHFAGLVNYKPGYRPYALRYEVGEASNFVLVPMLLEALKVLNAWGPHRIQAYCEALTREAVQPLREQGYWIETAAHRAHHLWGVRLPKGLALDRLKETLERARVYVSIRGNALRVSPHVYNDPQDLQRLVECLQIAMR